MLPKMVNLNGIIYNTAGMVKLNNGAFLIVENQNQLTNIDFTQIPGLSITQFEVKKPTGVELAFVNYIQTVMQDKINNGEITNFSDLKKAVSEINGYVNGHEQLLANMRELDNRDDIVESLKANLLDYFAEEMSNNQYFQKPLIEETTETLVEQPIDVLPMEETVEEAINFEVPEQEQVTNAVEQPVNEVAIQPITVEPQIMESQVEVEPVFDIFEPQVETIDMSQYQDVNTTNIIGSIDIQPEVVADSINIEQPNITPKVPEYNEQTVNMILYKQSEMPDPNFDVESFVNQYFSSLTNNQIDLLLNNFKLSEKLKIILQQRKETLQVFNSLEQAEVKQTESVKTIEDPAKRKKFVRNQPNNKGQAAFADTLLLSFTVGTMCGVYLMYFVLTIMS